MQRIAISLLLAPGTRERAEELVAEGPPIDLAEAGFTAHSILLGNDQAVFIFEGEDVERTVRDLLDDPARASSFAAWAAILAESPRSLREVFSWKK
ncbi:MAG TPA: hypothetical protein VHK22_06020 [Gaiellaceae bacterium]|nr:hypothetical protein [Gaiellaceae bacterium]